jgi:hypothetical protein
MQRYREAHAAKSSARSGTFYAVYRGALDGEEIKNFINNYIFGYIMNDFERYYDSSRPIISYSTRNSSLLVRKTTPSNIDYNQPWVKATEGFGLAIPLGPDPYPIESRWTYRLFRIERFVDFCALRYSLKYKESRYNYVASDSQEIMHFNPQSVCYRKTFRPKITINCQATALPHVGFFTGFMHFIQAGLGFAAVAKDINTIVQTNIE